MTAHRRHRRSAAGQIASDTACIANRLSWKTAAVFGVALFVVFYCAIPVWLISNIPSPDGKAYRGTFEILLARRIGWFQWIGIVACANMRVFLGAKLPYLPAPE
jgi:hypothetical protein